MFQIPLKLSPFQREFLEKSDWPTLSLMTGISAGKTRAAALWSLLQAGNGKRIICAAQNFRALKFVLFREIIGLCNLAQIPFKHNKSDHTIEFNNGGTIFGSSADAETGLVGLTDIHGVLIDEAALASEDYHNFLLDRARGENVDVALERYTTSPNGSPSSNWYSNWAKMHPECIIRATSFDNPFTSADFKRRLKERYGEGSPMYRQQVLGEIIDVDLVNSVFKKSWYVFSPYLAPGKRFGGVDLAGSGRDETVFTILDGCQILDQVAMNDNGDSGVQSSKLLELSDAYNCWDWALDDTGGWAGGLYAEVKHHPRLRLIKANFGAASDQPKDYRNLRTQMAFQSAAYLKDGFFVDQEKYRHLVEELDQFLFFIDNQGRNAIIPKEDMKKVLGHSPDRADSFILAHYAQTCGARGNDARSAMQTLKTLNNLGYL